MQYNIEEIKAKIAGSISDAMAEFKDKPFDPKTVAEFMTKFLRRVAAEAFDSETLHDIQVVASGGEDGRVVITPGNLQTFIFMQGFELPPVLPVLDGLTEWRGARGTYSIKDGQYYYLPHDAPRITFTAQLDPEVLKELLRTDEAEVIKRHQDGEDRAARVGVVCNSAKQFVHLKNRFAEREDLKGYRLLMIDDDRKAQRLADVMDFAVLYMRGESMSQNTKRAYAMLERYQVKIRLAFFQIVNYTE